MNAAQVLNGVAYARGQWAYRIGWIPKYQYNLFHKERNKRDLERILLSVADAHLGWAEVKAQSGQTAFELQNTHT